MKAKAKTAQIEIGIPALEKQHRKDHKCDRDAGDRRNGKLLAKSSLGDFSLFS